MAARKSNYLNESPYPPCQGKVTFLLVPKIAHMLYDHGTTTLTLWEIDIAGKICSLLISIRFTTHVASINLYHKKSG